MTMRVPAGLHLAAKRIAGERGETLNDVMTGLLHRYVEHYEREERRDDGV
jgi:hypothetical protein